MLNNTFRIHTFLINHVTTDYDSLQTYQNTVDCQTICRRAANSAFRTVAGERSKAPQLHLPKYSKPANSVQPTG